MRKNKVINVMMLGGILGLFNSPKKTLEKAIQKHNNEGWGVRQIIKPSLNPLFLILCLAILLVTLFFYMPASGYMVILEKEIKI